MGALNSYTPKLHSNEGHMRHAYEHLSHSCRAAARSTYTINTRGHGNANHHVAVTDKNELRSHNVRIVAGSTTACNSINGPTQLHTLL